MASPSPRKPILLGAVTRVVLQPAAVSREGCAQTSRRGTAATISYEGCLRAMKRMLRHHVGTLKRKRQSRCDGLFSLCSSVW